MAYRILAAALVACLAGPGVARAEKDQIDLLYPECRNTPIGQMTRGQLKKCEAIEGFLAGTKDLFDKARAEAAAKDRAAPSQQECLDASVGVHHLPGCVYVSRGAKLSAEGFAPR